MKIKPLVFSIFLLTIIVASSFRLLMIGKIASVYAQVAGQTNNFSPNHPLSACTTVEVPISGSTLKATYTVHKDSTVILRHLMENVL